MVDESPLGPPNIGQTKVLIKGLKTSQWDVGSGVKILECSKNLAARMPKRESQIIQILTSTTNYHQKSSNIIKSHQTSSKIPLRLWFVCPIGCHQHLHCITWGMDHAHGSHCPIWRQDLQGLVVPEASDSTFQGKPLKSSGKSRSRSFLSKVWWPVRPCGWCEIPWDRGLLMDQDCECQFPSIEGLRVSHVSMPNCRHVRV